MQHIRYKNFIIVENHDKKFINTNEKYLNTFAQRT